MKQPNDRRKTYEEVLQSFMELLEPDPPPPPPKPAAQRAEERWSQKPMEAVIRDEATHNETLIERLKTERRAAEQAEILRSQYQGLIDRVWQNQLDYQASLADLAGPSFHKGPGDADW